MPKTNKTQKSVKKTPAKKAISKAKAKSAPAASKRKSSSGASSKAKAPKYGAAFTKPIRMFKNQGDYF